LWKSATTPFIQVTSDGTDAPMRQTVSSLGTDVEDEVPLLAEPDPELTEFDPELQPAMASAATAHAAAAVILCRTTGVLLARLCFGSYRRN
jgi:hypothetical protein